jgi:hypothetical protein
MTKSDNPDVLNIFTREKVSVNQFNAGWGYGWVGMESSFGEDSKPSQLQTLRGHFY